MKYLLILIAVIAFNGCSVDDAIEEYDQNQSEQNNNKDKDKDKNKDEDDDDDTTVTVENIEQLLDNNSTTIINDNNSTTSYDLDLVDYVFPDGNITKSWDILEGEKVWMPDSTFYNMYSMQEIVHKRDENVSLISDLPILTTGTITLNDDNITIQDTNATLTHSRYISAEVDFNYSPKFDTCKYIPKAWKSFTLSPYSYSDVAHFYCKKDTIGYHLFFQKGLGLAFYYTSRNEWYFSY